MTIILFFIIFGVVVLSHEFGHFVIAKKNGIHVIEFSIGMGPMIFHMDKKGTRYAIRLFPFGGACMFEGEDGLENANKAADTELGIEQVDIVQGQSRKAESLREEIETNYGGSFLDASIGGRIATVFAGPFFNLLLGFIIAVISVGFNGSDRPVVQAIQEGSAAQEAGMEEGDTILRVNGKRIHLFRELSFVSQLNKDGETMTIEYARDGEKYTSVITPKYSEADGRYYLGFVNGGEYIECKGLQVFQYGFYEAEYAVKSTIQGIKMLFTGKLGKDDVSGPIGIAGIVDDTYDVSKEYGMSAIIFNMLYLVLLLSINLGIMNLLPLPALDGGRLVFLLIELVRGKPVPPDKEGMVHFIGLIFFFALMIYVMYNDIIKLIG